MNKAILHGNCGKDADVRTLESGKKIAKFSIATKSYRKDKDGNNITAWHNVIAWEKLAELAEKYVRKGSELIIEGEIAYGSYTDKEGVVKYTTDIICNSIEFCGKKETKEDPLPDKQGQYQGGKVHTGSMSNINELPGANDDPEMPF